MLANTYTLNTQKAEEGESIAQGHIQLLGKILSFSKTKQNTNRIEKIPEGRQVKSCLKIFYMTSDHGKYKGRSFQCSANVVMGKNAVLMQ